MFKAHYLEEVRKYCPTLRIDDLRPYPAGVRAQAVLRNGQLVDDFLFVNTRRTIHVCNAPSPAATSAIPIGAFIVDKVKAQVAGQAA
jgi:L-2-hydroxyglutarate oxidase